MLFTSMIIINIRSCSQTYGQWRHGPMASAVARAYNGGCLLYTSDAADE